MLIDIGILFFTYLMHVRTKYMHLTINEAILNHTHFLYLRILWKIVIHFDACLFHWCKHILSIH